MGAAPARETYRECHFLREGMYVHNGRVAGADDVLVIQDRELRLELTHSVYRLLQAREDEARADIVVLDTA